MATPAKKKKLDSIPQCPYGARCFRKNPQHLAEFSHPKKDSASVSDSVTDSVDGPSTSSLSPADDSSLPPCKYGASCYRKNLMHFAEFSHPTSTSSVQKDDSGSDTDEISDEDVSQ